MYKRQEHGILVHQYGPHIFHTKEKQVYDYLSRFTEWYPYSHEVGGNIYGKIVPVPFNLNTLKIVYGKERGAALEKKLVDAYGMGSRVPILELKNHEDEDIREIADYVYQNIFLKYTMKQWGQTPEEIDPSVTGRVPVLISYDNRYFQDKYQGMPLKGYTRLFENMLDHKNITVECNVDARRRVGIRDNRTYLDGEPFDGPVIYTGAIDRCV